MHRWSLLLACFLLAALLHAQTPASSTTADHSRHPDQRSYYGFDRNEYPGDAEMKALRRHFDYTGYWLNVPPGAASNSWTGKRAKLEALGFGFLVLFNGRLDAELAKAANAASLGQSDASEAAMEPATEHSDGGGAAAGKGALRHADFARRPA